MANDSGTTVNRKTEGTTARHWGAGLCIVLHAAAAFAGGEELELTQLSLEDLLKIEVTSVSRKSQRLTDTAAAAFVLTAEDIQRAGVTSLPEALRMVPGLDVARLGSSRWAVSARGFNGRFAQKLLVLIDGRSVYSPLFSGVFWEAEDVMLEDLDRIEVIRGPGAALWGANAVNGVINIITKKARQTQGGLVAAQAGNVDRGILALRQGGRAGEAGAFRVWAKLLDRAEFSASDRSDSEGGEDASRSARAGFRVDAEGVAGGRLTVVGNASRSTSGEVLYGSSLVPPYAVPMRGGQTNRGVNLLGRYEWTMAGGSQTTVQSYIDHTDLDQQVAGEHRTTFDVDFQNRVVSLPGHDLIWGAGYRISRDRLESASGFLALTPRERTFTLSSAFVHDEIDLVPERWRVVLGSKVERNTYTGVELQPNLRLLYTPSATDTLWAAVSRAARTPSRAERDADVLLSTRAPGSAENPGPLPVRERAVHNEQLDAEKLTALELGYRGQVGSGLSIDLATFHNVYRDLRAGRSLGATPVLTGPVPYVDYAILTSNTLRATSNGFELAVDGHPAAWWRLQAAYTWFRMRGERNGDPANDGLARLLEGSVPRHQLSLRSSMNLGTSQQFDAWLRHVDRLPALGVDAYTELDLRYAYKVTRQFELSLVGQNLLAARHAEFVPDLVPGKRLDVGRAGYLRARWQF